MPRSTHKLRMPVRQLGLLFGHLADKLSRALFQDAPYIFFPVQNGDNLKWGRLWPLHNGVVGVAGQRPETQRTGCEVGTGMAAHGRFGNKRASVVNRLFYAVGGVFAVIGNVTPDVKNIRFGKRRESINAHRLDKRQSSFIAWISRRARAPSISSPRSACR